MAIFRGSFFYFRGIFFAFRGRNRPEPPCNFFPAVHEDDTLWIHVSSSFFLSFFVCKESYKENIYHKHRQGFLLERKKKNISRGSAGSAVIQCWQWLTSFKLASFLYFSDFNYGLNVFFLVSGVICLCLAYKHKSVLNHSTCCFSLIRQCLFHFICDLFLQWLATIIGKLKTRPPW